MQTCKVNNDIFEYDFCVKDKDTRPFFVKEKDLKYLGHGFIHEIEGVHISAIYPKKKLERLHFFKFDKKEEKEHKLFKKLNI